MTIGLGIVVVEICDRNTIALKPLEELEIKYPEIAVIRTDCLNMCNMCRARPFALVDGERIYAKKPEKAMEQIEAEIIRALEQWN